MSIINKFLEYIRSPKTAILSFMIHTAKMWNDETFLKLQFRLRMGYKLNLDNPKTFSEKLQWLKLYDHNPKYTVMADKVKAKEYVASVLGEEYIIPTLGVWDNPDDIDFESLPNRFVLKCNHNSGLGMCICKDKSHLDKKKVCSDLKIGLKQDYFASNREWPYKDVPRRILAEKFIDPAPNVSDLTDYKWYCFDGEPKYCQVIQDRSTRETIDFFDTEWNHLEFIGLNPVAGPAVITPLKPLNLDIHLRIARELSKGIPFSRIDVYETGDHTYFGEITFYPASGFGVFRPDQYNEILGQMIKLPGEKRGRVIIKQQRDNKLTISTPDLSDYKFFCFNGSVKFFKIDFDRFSHHCANYYSPRGELLDMYEVDYPSNPKKDLLLPNNLNKMISMAEQLSKGISFVRVDFYNIYGKIYFGELTFFPASGMGRLAPSGVDETIGEYLFLPI